MVKILTKNKKSFFKFKPFSTKQTKVLSWWTDASPVSDKNGIIADGAIRSGKTLSMSLSFVMWAMERFTDHNFGMCGKTIGSFRRNVLFWLKLMLMSRRYTVREYRADNYITVQKNDVLNYFYIFGGKDERSQDLIQGITLAGCFFDEVALMPQSFVNQATGRCSVEGSTFWFNCNPAFPSHWFYTDWIKKHRALNIIYLHFTMNDNLSLSEKIKQRYENMYAGVFHDRYVKGLWVNAEGIIYRLFADNPTRYFLQHTKDGKVNPEFPHLMEVNAAFDPGGTASNHAFVATGITPYYKQIIALRSERHSAEGTTPKDLDEKAVAFVGKVIEKYGRCDILYYDNEASVLGRGIKDAVEKVYPQTSVRPCYKGLIRDRIDFMSRMLGLDRFKYTEDCDTLKEALEQSVWNPKVEDERLDDGTTPVDDLDALEYCTSAQIKRFIF